MKRLIVIMVLFALTLMACSADTAPSEREEGVPVIVLPGDPLTGATLYVAVCSNCHGRDLQGVQGLGKPLAPSNFVTDATENDLATLIIVGRARDHPENTTGVDMLPRSGNPLLSDQQIQDIAAYLKAHN